MHGSKTSTILKYFHDFFFFLYFFAPKMGVFFKYILVIFFLDCIWPVLILLYFLNIKKFVFNA